MLSAFEWLKSLPPVERYGKGTGPAVQMSDDLKRILALPRRTPPDLDGPAGAALVELMNGRLRRSGQPDPCRCSSLGRPCITSLRPIQAWALYEAPLAGGLIAPIGVGHGKTLLDLLAPVVLASRQCVLLVPPGLVEQLVREYLALREHFVVPSLIVGERGWVSPGAPALHVATYSRLSRADATTLLERLAPDLLISDEAHKLRHAQTSTTGRVLRYWIDHPGTRLCAWSGTLTARSIKDYAHLCALALKDGSPLPLDPQIVEEWATALDPVDVPADPGALLKLEESDEWLGVGNHGHLADRSDQARRAFHVRLVSTRGVVATKEGSLGASLNILERKPPAMPDEVKRLLRDLRAGWQRPDGEELIDAVAVARSARELACGFYYRWTFPRAEPVALIDAWFAARKAWHRELRHKLQRREPHLDSPLLCTKAAIRCDMAYVGELPVWHSLSWPAWRDVRALVEPEPEAVWVSDWLARDAADWARRDLGIVWYEHHAFGQRVAELAELPLHGGGAMAESRLRAEKGDRSIVASIKAHGTGRDGLQYIFSKNLVANPPSSGATWEQLLGRTHRVGQRSDEVEVWTYRHTPELRECLDDAIGQARYIHATLGLEQKLLTASLGF